MLRPYFVSTYQGYKAVKRSADADLEPGDGYVSYLGRKQDMFQFESMP